MSNRIAARKLRLIEDILASGYAPLEIMFRVMMGDTTITPLQLKAAEMAAPYVRPRLAPIQVESVVRPKATEEHHASDDPQEAARVYRDFMVGKG